MASYPIIVRVEIPLYTSILQWSRFKVLEEPLICSLCSGKGHGRVE